MSATGRHTADYIEAAERYAPVVDLSWEAIKGGDLSTFLLIQGFAEAPPAEAIAAPHAEGPPSSARPRLRLLPPIRGES